MSFSQGGTAARWNPAPEFWLNHNISMHNWRINTEELILNHFEGNKGTMYYKCLYKETYDCHAQKYVANFGFKYSIKLDLPWMYSWNLEIQRWPISYMTSFFMNKVLKEEVELFEWSSYNNSHNLPSHWFSAMTIIFKTRSQIISSISIWYDWGGNINWQNKYSDEEVTCHSLRSSRS